MKKTLYTLAFIFGTVAMRSQEGMPNITPPYPATTQLGTYGNVPIGLETGKPNINLDIYTLKEGDVSVPIQVSYSSSGVKVDAIPTQLGMEWQLIAGGVISCEVRGTEDLSDTGFYNPSDISDVCTPSSTTSMTLIGSQENTQKDIFSYSAPGISGKFFLNGNEIVQINPSDDKIEKLTLTDEEGRIIKYFKITDPQGNEYFFGESAESRERSGYRNNCWGSTHGQTSYQTGWYLTRMITNKHQMATFKYEQETYDYAVAVNQKAQAVIPNGIILAQVAGIGSPCKSYESHVAAFLTEIDCKDKKIVFNYNTLDSFEAESKQLTSLEIFAGPNKIKSFDFHYNLVAKNLSSPLLNTQTLNNPAKKSIYLREIDERSEGEGLEAFKKYGFEYYSPEQIPPRFSYAQDIYGYYNGRPNQNFVYNNLEGDAYLGMFSSANADREPNPDTVFFGMLKTIVYPTGGKTEFTYEPNSVYDQKTIYPPYVDDSFGAEATGNNTTVYTPAFTCPFNQTGILSGSAEWVDLGESSCAFAESHPQHSECKVELIDVTNGNNVVATLTVNGEDEMTIALIAGNVYKVRISSIHPCANTYGSIKYRDTAPYVVYFNRPCAGVRVRTTKSFDNPERAIIKRYYYAELDDLDRSTGHFVVADPKYEPNVDRYVSENYQHIDDEIPTSTIEFIYTMPSSPKTPLCSLGGGGFTYGAVVESFGDAFENGGVLHTYGNDMDEPPVTLCGDYVRGAPFSPGFANQEISNLTFKKSGNTFLPVTSEEFVYEHDESKDIKIQGYTGREWELMLFPISQEHFNEFCMYETRSERHYLSSKTTKTFDLNGSNPIITTENYHYDGTNHYQVTSVDTQTSRGDLLETKYYHPGDAAVSGEPFISELLGKNMKGIVLQTEEYLNSVKTNTKKVVYGAWATQLFLPHFTQTSKENQPLETRIEYAAYDDSGNLLQVQQKGGVPVSYIWGYQQNQPVAKVEGIDFLNIPPSHIADIQNASNSDNNSLLIALDALRNDPALARTMITGFTYKPLTGVEKVIDPNGKQSTYGYDEFGRLKSVRDNDGNLLSENQYHYRPN